MPCAKGSCHILRKQIGILSDGTVVPCCMDTSGVMGLGNLFTQELSEILASKRAVAMKKGFERGEFTEKLCQQCEFGRKKQGIKLNAFCIKANARLNFRLF